MVNGPSLEMLYPQDKSFYAGANFANILAEDLVPGEAER